MRWYKWLICVLLVLAFIGRLITYAVLGPDVGTTTVVHSVQGDYLTFFGLSNGDDRTVLMDKIGQLVYRTPKFTKNQTGALSVSGAMNEFSDDSILSPFYLETSHPCNSFYDATCGLVDSIGTGSLAEDLLVTNDQQKRSSGLFYDVTRFSNSIVKNIISQNVYYRTCVSEGNFGWLNWNNIQVPDGATALRSPNNQTAVGLAVLSKLISKGIRTPLILKIQKVLHKAEFGLEIDFDMLPIMDITFHGSLSDDGGRPDSLFQFYDEVLTNVPNITNVPETISDYMAQSTDINRLRPLTKELFKTIFPNITKITNVRSFDELDIVVSLLVELIGSDPLTFWDYFHRLSIYYETLPYLDDTDDMLLHKTFHLNQIVKKDWILLIFQNIKLVSNRKTYKFGGRNLMERFTHKKWGTDLVENVEYVVKYHLPRHEIEFSIIRRNDPHALNLLSTKSDNVSQICSNLVERIDRLWLNDQFSQINEITYTDGTQRTTAITNLVTRVLNATYGLLNESSFGNAQTKSALLQKVTDVVVRVKGDGNIPFHDGFDQWGFKWPLYPTPKGGRSKTTLYSGLYNFLQNSFQLNNIRLMADDYVQYRSTLMYYFWEDIDIPYDVVNAWYDPLENTITIPIGITLVPMYFNTKFLDPLRIIIGHEIGHALDNNGRLFDSLGNYVYNDTINNEADDGLWWPSDYSSINTSINCLAKDYGHPCGNEEYGYHTMGEDIADQIGVRTGLRLVKEDFHKEFEAQYPPFVNVSRMAVLKEFFITYGRLWCGRSSINNQCNQVETDPHALAKHRVNKTLRQIKEFIETFRCRESSNMFKPSDAMCLIYPGDKQKKDQVKRRPSQLSDFKTPKYVKH